jgi:hypothetical protein
LWDKQSAKISLPYFHNVRRSLYELELGVYEI